MAPETARRLRELPKGDALATAQLAGIMAAKRTSELIPLCHPLPLSHVDVELAVGEDAVEITATAETTAQTGVEMEALVAASVAALTVYDMAKAIDKGMVVEDVRLVEKTKEPRVKAAVLTVSDGVSAGHARGPQRRRARGAARRRGLRGRAPGRARRARADRGRDRASSPQRARLVLTTGGTGFGAARRDARGDGDGARPRRARDRRGDPRRLDREDAARPALARARRRPRHDARRQPARLDRRLAATALTPSCLRPALRQPPARGASSARGRGRAQPRRATVPDVTDDRSPAARARAPLASP